MARKARKKSSLANVTRRAAKKKPAPRSNPVLVGNPPFWEDAYHDVVPGLVGYAGTRVVGRIAYKLGKRKSPRLAKHLGPWASVLSTLALWFGIHRKQEWAEKYHTAIVGSAIASIQGLVQTYVPQYGWVLNDYHMDDMIPAPAPGAQPQAKNGSSPTAQGQYLEAGDADFDDEDEFAAVLNDGETIDDLRTGIFG